MRANATGADGTDIGAVEVQPCPTPPTMICPSSIVVNNDPGQCSELVNYEVDQAKRLAGNPHFDPTKPIELDQPGGVLEIRFIGLRITTAMQSFERAFLSALPWRSERSQGGDAG